MGTMISRNQPIGLAKSGEKKKKGKVKKKKPPGQQFLKVTLFLLL